MLGVSQKQPMYTASSQGKDAVQLHDLRIHLLQHFLLRLCLWCEDSLSEAYLLVMQQILDTHVPVSQVLDACIGRQCACRQASNAVGSLQGKANSHVQTSTQGGRGRCACVCMKRCRHVKVCKT